MSITLHDLAVMAHVNASTVSRALRGDSRVKAETREAICRLAHLHGYVPNRAARSLATGGTGTIWLILSDLESELERCAAIRIGAAIEENSGYDLLIAAAGNSPERFARLVGRLSQKLADAAVVVAPLCTMPDGVTKQLETLSCPVVYLDRELPGSRLVITSDNASAARALTERLCGICGDNPLFLLDFPAENAVSVLRRSAAAKFLDARGIRYFERVAELRKFLAAHPATGVAVLAENYRSDAVANLAGAGAKRIAGGFFDHFDAQFAPIACDAVFVCRQDFEGLSVLASDAILRLLHGKTVPARQLLSCRIEHVI